MKICILKSGKYSLNNGLGPVRIFEENEEVSDLDDNNCNNMIKDGWAEVVEYSDDEKNIPVDEEKSTQDILDELILGKEESEAKSILQDWGEVKTGIKTPKSKSVGNMIEEIALNLDSMGTE
jgi:hypothetical protein